MLASLLFSAMVPFGNNPDEVAHWDNIRLMSTTKSLPVFVPPQGRAPLPENVRASIQKATGMSELPEGALSRDEAHQPPLYYILAATLRIMGGDVFVIRMLSAAAAALTVMYCCWWAGCHIGDEYVRPLGALLCIFPIQAQLGGAVSNDALTHLLCAIIIGETISLLKASAVTKRGLVLLTFAITLGLYTKLTVLQLLPWLLAVCLVWKYSSKTLTMQFLVQLGIVLVCAGLFTLPMWLRNVSLYADPLARTIYTATGPNFSPAEIEKLAGWTHADYLRQVGVRSLASFWYFLHPNTPLSRFAGEPLPFIAVILVTAPALVGLVRTLRDSETAVDRRVLIALLTVPLVIVPFYFAFVSQVFQAQGRYFLPALLPVSVLTVIGWKRLSSLGWIVYIPALLLGLIAVKQLLGGGFASL